MIVQGYYSVKLCAPGEGLEGGGARALYQARTGSRLLPTHRPWRLATPPSPFFGSRLRIATEGSRGMMMVKLAREGAKVQFLHLVGQF